MKGRSFETPLEHRRLLRLAREYRRGGYDVVMYPQDDELPQVLQGCSIGLIARGQEDVVVADARSRQNLTLNGPADLRRLAEKVGTLPGWQFDLVITNPRSQKAAESSQQAAS